MRSYSATMIDFTLMVITTLLQVDTIKADGRHVYVGCCPAGPHWQELFGNDYISTSVDDCVSHCSSNTYAAISVRTCYCSDKLAVIPMAEDHHCNVNCTCNPSQICGSSTHYSVYYTTERLNNSTLPHTNTTPSRSPGCEPFGGTMPSDRIGDSPTCVLTNKNHTENECRQEVVDTCCRCHPVWMRIVIDVTVIFVALSIIILVFVVVRCCRKRRRGMFDQWKPRAFRRRSHVEAGSHISGDDPLRRNHSYRNLSGSSTLDRGLGLESIEQVTGASAITVPVQSLGKDRVNKHGSLQIPAKGASASTPNRRAATMNQHNHTKALQVTETKALDDYVGQTCNRPAAPDPKNKPRQNTKTSDKKTPKDAANGKDTIMDKPKRKSLLNFLSKDVGTPSSPDPPKDANSAPNKSDSVMNKTWVSQYGKKDTKKSEATEKRNSCSVSNNEAVFADPKCNTLPNDIYAVPHQPAGRNRQAKERSASDTTKGATSSDVENQGGYSRLSRLFKPRIGGSGKPKRGEDATSPEEYSVLHAGSKDIDYDKLGGQGETGGHFGQEEIRGSDRKHNSILAEADTYASVDDMGYAAVGGAIPEASQSGDYEMVTQGQMK